MTIALLILSLLSILVASESGAWRDGTRPLQMTGPVDAVSSWQGFTPVFLDQVTPGNRARSPGSRLAV
jgi:hypothetical protein